MITNKNKIALIAFELSMQDGFDNVSVKEISEKSGVAVGSIYYHFKDKDEILLYMVHMYLMDNFQEFKEAVKKFNGSFIEKIEFIFNYKTNSFIKEEDILYTASEHEFDYKKYFTLLTSIFHQNPETRHLFYQLHEELYSFYYDLVKDAIEKKEIRDDIDIESLVMFIQSNLKGYIDLWVYQPDISFKKLVDSNLKMIWEAIKVQ
ncbi:MAG: TetR/AcrR family transcriptional regulator [Methanobrevibacter sp.]|nr:TetR/AcrR family transcriptional regulator [Methanobrevibacter sp.]